MKCKVCGIDYNDRFYDKSTQRPICSKECYSKFFDEWTAKDSCCYAIMSEERRVRNLEAQRRWREKHPKEYVEYYKYYRKKKAIAVL